MEWPDGPRRPDEPERLQFYEGESVPVLSGGRLHRVPVVAEGDRTWVDALTYRKLMERHDRLLAYVHRNLHRAMIPESSCRMCDEVRRELENG